VEENLRVLGEAQANALTKEELVLFKKARDIYTERIQVLCTDCKYCLPCPEQVNIPRVFSIFNDASIYNNIDGSRWLYDGLVKKEEDAGRCIACGQCEALCPQNLNIIDSLASAHRAFSSSS